MPNNTVTQSDFEIQKVRIHSLGVHIVGVQICTVTCSVNLYTVNHQRDW